VTSSELPDPPGSAERGRHDPSLVERLILVGTGPRAGQGIDRVTSTTLRYMFRAALHRTDPKRYIFYTHDAHGEAEARKILARLDSRTKEHANTPMAVRSFLRQLRGSEAAQNTESETKLRGDT
jgi:hydrolase, alpha/beta fold family domain protein